MINTSFLLEQSEPGAGPLMGRRVGEPADLPAASMGGRASWPTVRHLAVEGKGALSERGGIGIYKVSSGCCAK